MSPASNSAHQTHEQITEKEQPPTPFYHRPLSMGPWHGITDFVLFCFVFMSVRTTKSWNDQRKSDLHRRFTKFPPTWFPWALEMNRTWFYCLAFVSWLYSFQNSNELTGNCFFLTDWLVVGSFPFKIGFDGSTGIRRPENEFSQKDYEGFLPSCLLELFLFCVASNGFFSGRRVAFWRPQVNFLSRAGKRGVSGRVFRANSYFRCHWQSFNRHYAVAAVALACVCLCVRVCVRVCVCVCVCARHTHTDRRTETYHRARTLCEPP